MSKKRTSPDSTTTPYNENKKARTADNEEMSVAASLLSLRSPTTTLEATSSLANENLSKEDKLIIDITAASSIREITTLVSSFSGEEITPSEAIAEALFLLAKTEDKTAEMHKVLSYADNDMVKANSIGAALSLLSRTPVDNTLAMLKVLAVAGDNKHFKGESIAKALSFLSTMTGDDNTLAMLKVLYVADKFEVVQYSKGAAISILSKTLTLGSDEAIRKVLDAAQKFSVIAATNHDTQVKSISSILTKLANMPGNKTVEMQKILYAKKHDIQVESISLSLTNLANMPGNKTAEMQKVLAAAPDQFLKSIPISESLKHLANMPEDKTAEMQEVLAVVGENQDLKAKYISLSLIDLSNAAENKTAEIKKIFTLATKEVNLDHINSIINEVRVQKGRVAGSVLDSLLEDYFDIALQEEDIPMEVVTLGVTEATEQHGAQLDNHLTTDIELVGEH
jgi:predicted phosphatase